MNRASLILIGLFFRSILSPASPDTLRVLFLGNSYTAVNNLPEIISILSQSGGNVLDYDYNTPGGYAFENHSYDTSSLAKISRGNWDVVVLQDQSQLPTIDYYRYSMCYPAAERLRDSIRLYNPCARIMTYMTWGRRYGGQQCINNYCSPVFADFNHMQDSLQSAYEEESELIGASCAPVGVAWKAVLRDTTIVLHASDNSHPALAGSYLTACVFYSMIWRSSCVGLAPYPGIDSATCSLFQYTADSVVFQSVSDWNINIDRPEAAFTYNSDNDSVYFSNQSASVNGCTFHWDFGDGYFSTDFNPAHHYLSSGYYTVRLIATICVQVDTFTSVIPFHVSSVDELELNSRIFSYPNPTRDRFTIECASCTSGAAYELFDATGRKIGTGNFTEKILHLDISNFETGVYTLITMKHRIILIKQ